MAGLLEGSQIGVENLFEIGKEELSARESECVTEIAEWANSGSADFEPRKDEDFIVKFLLGCKFDVNKTKKKIIYYYETRKKYPQFFKNRDIYDERLVSLTKRGLLATVLNRADYKGHVVAIGDLSRLEENDNIYDILRLSVIAMDAVLLCPEVQRHGLVIIMNLSNIPMQVILQGTPKFWYRFVKCVLTAMPVRVKAIHLINAHAALTAVINTFKLCLKEKLRKRLHVYGKNWDSLFTDVPRDCIANEFGGSAGTMNELFDKFALLWDHCKDYLKDDEKYGFQDKNASSP